MGANLMKFYHYGARLVVKDVVIVKIEVNLAFQNIPNHFLKYAVADAVDNFYFFYFMRSAEF